MNYPAFCWRGVHGILATVCTSIFRNQIVSLTQSYSRIHVSIVTRAFHTPPKNSLINNSSFTHFYCTTTFYYATNFTVVPFSLPICLITFVFRLCCKQTIICFLTGDRNQMVVWYYNCSLDSLLYYQYYYQYFSLLLLYYYYYQHSLLFLCF